MMGKRLIASFFLWIIIFSPPSRMPALVNEECQIALLHSKMMEGVPGFSEDSSHESKYFNFFSLNQIEQRGIVSEEKSLNVIITGLQYTQEIYINENQIITVWSQNISSQTRKLYHKISGTYPDGSPFLIEEFPVEIPPGWTLCDSWALSNAGKGIGFFDFSCQVWEEVTPTTKIIHDEESGRYWARFYRPSGVSANYYCDDYWHHPSDNRILENALYTAAGCTSPREAATKLMNFVHSRVTYDPSLDFRISDIDVLFVYRRGVCIAFADLYIGLARSINIPTRIACGTEFRYSGGETDVCGAYCIRTKGAFHAWAESYYNGAFHHIDPTYNIMEYPRFYVGSSDVHSIHVSVYTSCSDSYPNDCSMIYDAECCLNGFINVTTVIDGGYDTKYYCPSDRDNDGICDSLDSDKDGDGIPNSDDPDPCTGTSLGFSSIPSLFSQNNFHVVGDPAYCTDVLGTANVSWIFGWNSLQRPEGRTDKILTSYEHNTGNLLITGGPAVNGVAQEFDQYFGITYIHNPEITFEIQCEGHSIFLDIARDYPRRDIAIIYLGIHNGRAVLLSWGYGWRGTYAATVLMSHPDIWTTYGNNHFLFVECVDLNDDGLITWYEIRVIHPYNVSLSPPPTGSSYLVSPIFWNVRQLFGGNSYHVVGDPAYCTDVLGTANVSWVFGSEHNQYYMQRPEGRTDSILTSYEHNTGNLLITGGPAVNGAAQEFDQYFGITYIHNPGITFEIACEGYSIFLDIAHDYPRKDICIVFLGQQNSRNILLIWGYGWRGTYAGTLVMANTSVWSSYSGHHLLLLEWTDWNSDGLVQISEILVKYP